VEDRRKDLHEESRTLLRGDVKWLAFAGVERVREEEREGRLAKKACAPRKAWARG
jgi:hypothetical protein